MKENLSSAQIEARKREKNLTARRIASQTYLWFLLLLLYAPIVLIIVFSFTKSKVLGNWTGFTFGLYKNLFTGYDHVAQVHVDPNLYHSLFYTLLIAVVAATFATLLGTLAAIGIFNMRAKGRKSVQFLNSIPMINPDILTGISLFLLFVFLGISRGLATVIIAHVVFCTPYVVLSVMPRLTKMNPNIYEAALDLGARPHQALFKIIIPQIFPGILSGFILSITLSLDDYIITAFTRNNSFVTLSTYVYGVTSKRGAIPPTLRALTTIIVVVTLAVLIGVNIYTNHKKPKRNRGMNA